jgi:predicted permease
MGTLLQDLRYGFRHLLKSPGFTLIAVLSLALGIGANTSIFSLVNTVLLRPLPGVENPKRLVSVYPVRQDRSTALFSYPNLVDVRDRNEVLSGLSGFKFATLSLSHDGNNERVWSYLVSGNYFDVLGVKAALGRTFLPEEDRTPGSHPVVVLSYNCWQRRFSSAPAIIGRSIILNGHTFNVIGVAPEGFNGTEVVFQPEMWVPMMMADVVEPGSNWMTARGTGVLFTVGRLKPGVSVAQAQSSLSALARQLGEEHPDTSRGEAMTLNPPGLLVPRLRRPAIAFAGILMLVVGLVLLLACINLANLLLARATGRRKEIAIRLALGASRWRLLRQLLTESLLLSVTGGLLGLFLAWWINSLIAVFKPPVDFPILIDLKIDWRVLIFTIVASLLTGILFGLLPALQATKPDVVTTLKADSAIGGYRRSRLRNALIVAQMALSLILLICAGLVLRSVQQVQKMNPGFEPDKAVEISLDLGLQGYDAARGQEFYRQLAERVAVVPGVEAVSFANYLPLSFSRVNRGIYVEGQPAARGAQLPSSLNSRVAPDYFRVMGIPVLHGRDFNAQDKEQEAKVAIVNEAFTRRFWPGLASSNEALGKRFSFAGTEGTFWEVIAVAKDGKYISLSESPQPFVYIPLQNSDLSLTLVARTASNPQATLTAIRNEVRQLDATLPVYDAKSLTEHMSLSLFPTRVAAVALGSFGLLALGLAVIGLYGIVSYSVAQRTQEIGVRIALGARVIDLHKLIIGQGMKLALIGMAFGIIGALALAKLMSSLLIGVSPTDPVIFAGITLLLILVVLLACYVPARRATKVDPMTALRYE